MMDALHKFSECKRQSLKEGKGATPSFEIAILYQYNKIVYYLNRDTPVVSWM